MRETADGILAMRPYFDAFELTPADSPACCSAVVPNRRALETWTNFPAAARPQSGRFAGGRGLSHEESLVSGIGEAVELASCCSWGDEKLTVARPRDLEQGAIGSIDLLGFSDSQRGQRHQWNTKLAGLDWIPPECPPDREIGWAFACDGMTEDTVAVPADFVYIGRRNPEDGDAVAIADSNGCASGASNASAKIRALLELIERDATGRWWYGLRRRPTLPPDVLDDHSVLQDALVSRERRFCMFDITSDLEVPCVAAVSSGADERNVALGFAAAIDMRDAALSAVLEMLQIELSLGAVVAATEPQEPWRSWLADVSMTFPLFAVSERIRVAPRCDADQPDTILDLLLARCRDHDCRVLFFDLTRPEFRIPTWRALSPDLCHYKPRFGRRRLLAADPRDLECPGGPRTLPNDVLLSI